MQKEQKNPKLVRLLKMQHLLLLLLGFRSIYPAGDGATQTNNTDAVELEKRHDVVRERRKRKEFEVIVGGLDKDATEDDIRKVFSQIGEVVEVRLMMTLFVVARLAGIYPAADSSDLVALLA
ncbi:hypothetical protein CCACVL1_19112 [Corchorus capsularis]|uniref:RRM domain-containing protein n=1 Tax=Corchorus capsularis TaxID=210143 RepID=A0A1R3HIB1_COCAP|nr:hypothetical protein CCACVL1_19112 [Corchorus capsularis]